MFRLVVAAWLLATCPVLGLPTTSESLWKWNAKEFPNPQTEPDRCHRRRPSYVCDPESVLKPGEANRLDWLVRSLRNQTDCLCAHNCTEHGPPTIGIALLKYMHRPYSEPVEEIAQNFAATLRQRWKLGTCDDDIIILLATEDYQSSTYLGRTAQDIIGVEESERIWNESILHFKTGVYYQGLEALVESYYDAIRRAQGQPGFLHHGEEGHHIGAGPVAVSIVFGAIALILILGALTVCYHRHHGFMFKRFMSRSAHRGIIVKPASAKRTSTKENQRDMEDGINEELLNPSSKMSGVNREENASNFSSRDRTKSSAS